ncbi:glycosyltransferase [Dialister succinatiphilus]|uniref:glycosyltransferase n=1 Tax=Dialister succinatiphilus TaxID=487173 RepID=UPI004029F809
MKLAGVVTLYHPDKAVISNIETYSNDLDFLYVLDNTENSVKEISKWTEKKPHTRYFWMGGNMGISYALNFALKQAQGKYEYLLTMDQDSAFDEGMITQYKKDVEEMEREYPNKIGMYSINYDRTRIPIQNNYRLQSIAITSGSIIPVNSSLAIGGFDENLFIDDVDSEFCYRLRRNGRLIVEFPYILLNHTIGNQTFLNFFGKRIVVYNHGAIRKYYIIRNRIYVLKKYPEVRLIYLAKLVSTIAKVILAEDNKLKKMKYISRGIYDGIKGNMGKFTGF